jgi:hypothetical protein
MNRILGVLLLVLGSSVAWSWFWPQATTETKPLEPKQKASANTISFGEPDLRQLEEARFYLDTKSLVFGMPPALRPIVPKSPPTETKTTLAPTTEAQTPKETEPKAAPTRPTFGWRLAGVIEGSGGTRALFVSGSGSRSMRRGQVLDGWTIRSISQTGVGLSNQGFARTLVLFDKDNVPEASYPRAGTEEGQTQETNTSPAAPQSMQDFGPVRRGEAWRSPGDTASTPANATKGGPVSFRRRGDRPSTNSDGGAQDAAAPAN